MKRIYLKTQKPQMFCPNNKCKTRLRISNLNKKLWCENCNEYIPEEKLMQGFIKNIL